MNPLPSCCDGLPLMFETKNTSRSASYRTDSGVFMLAFRRRLPPAAGAAAVAAAGFVVSAAGASCLPHAESKMPGGDRDDSVRGAHYRAP